MDIDIAMAGIEGLIKLAIEVARTIGQAIDEANELMQQLPLVRSGVATVKTNLERHANVDTETRKYLLQFLKSVEQQIVDATKLMNQAKERLNRMHMPRPDDENAWKNFKHRVSRNKWFYVNRSALQAVNKSIATSIDRIHYVLDLIEKNAKFVPASVIADQDGRGFWQTHFGEANQVDWTLFFQALQRHYNERLHRNIGHQSENLRRPMCPDISNDHSITPFEFNQFLQWFAPLDGSVERAVALGGKSYYCGGINRLLAEDLVAPCPDGAFIVRWSSQVGRLAITYKLDGKICNAFIYMHGAKGCTDKANPQPDDFKPNVPALIADRDDLFKFSVLDVLRRLEHDDADAAQALILALERSVSNVSLGSGTGSSINLHVNHRGSGRGTVRSTATQPLHISVAGHSATAGTAQASPITASPRTEQVPSPAFTTASGVPSPVRTSAPTTPSAPVGRRESMEAIYGTLQTKYTPLQL